MDLTGERMMSITTGIQPTLPEPPHPLILIQFHVLTCVGNDPYFKSCHINPSQEIKSAILIFWRPYHP